jgi:hypothetical protein
MSTNYLYLFYAGVGVLVSFGIAFWVLRKEIREN